MCLCCAPDLQTLNAMTASRLQERLELLATLQAGMQELPSDWHTQVRGWGEGVGCGVGVVRLKL
jgi:hypothetical protein